MSLESTTHLVSYSGDGSTTVFPFPYLFLKNADLVVIEKNNTTRVETLKTITTHYTLTGAENESGGSVTMLVAPATGTTLIIYRDPALEQELELTQNQAYLMESLEKAYDLAMTILQRHKYLIERSIRLPEGHLTSLEMKLPSDIADTSGGIILALNEDRDGWRLMTAAEVGAEAGAFDPAEFGRTGFSARFSEDFATADLGETLDQILDFSYLAPLISLSASGSGTIREKGDAVTASTLTAAITKRSEDIDEVRFYDVTGGNTLLDTQTGVPGSGNRTYNWTGSFEDNQTFRAEVDDTPTGTTVSDTESFTFVYPYYVGAGAVGLSAANVALLTKRIIASDSNRTETITATAGQVFFFAYPATYGALTSILDENGFETFGDWTLRTENITGLDGNAVSYRIYEFENPVTADDYEFTFIR